MEIIIIIIIIIKCSFYYNIINYNIIFKKADLRLIIINVWTYYMSIHWNVYLMLQCRN